MVNFKESHGQFGIGNPSIPYSSIDYPTSHERAIDGLFHYYNLPTKTSTANHFGHTPC